MNANGGFPASTGVLIERAMALNGRITD
jgi:hypothetical protein